MKNQIVYIQTTNSIGVVLEQGEDIHGKWYRTDADGVRDSWELLFINTKKEFKRLVFQLKPQIAESTKKLINT